MSIECCTRSHSGWVSGDFGDIKFAWFCCAAICVLGLVMRLATATGTIGSDDLMYTYYAHGIAHSFYQLELHHMAIRYGLTLPVAGAFWLFGLKEWTTILVPLLASVASIPILIAIGWKLFGMRAGLLAGALFASFPFHLRYATILVPEPVAELYILVGVLCYVYAVDKNIIKLSLAAGICLGLAYLTKETAAFVASGTPA